MRGRVAGAPPSRSPRKEGRIKGVAAKEDRTTREGIVFQSRREMLRYLALLELKKAGYIEWIARQAIFDLPGGTHYKADFIVKWTETGLVAIEDAKGHSTDVYKLKKKQVEDLHNLKIEEH